jgi:hypothetical protein
VGAVEVVDIHVVVPGDNPSSTIVDRLHISLLLGLVPHLPYQSAAQSENPVFREPSDSAQSCTDLDASGWRNVCLQDARRLGNPPEEEGDLTAGQLISCDLRKRKASIGRCSWEQILTPLVARRSSAVDPLGCWAG